MAPTSRSFIVAGPESLPAFERTSVRPLPDRTAVQVDLTPAASSLPRLRRELDRAEERFVARVAGTGGIDRWRARADGEFAAARDSLPVMRVRTAGLVVALVDRVVRDRCWVAMERECPGKVDPRWRALWRHLTRHALAPYRAEPLFLLAWSCWRAGDRATARVVTDLVRCEDPAHPAAAMLDEVLRQRIDPRRLPALTGRPATGRTDGAGPG